MARLRGIIESAPTNQNGFSSIKVNGVYYGTYKTSHANLVGQEVEFDHTTKEVNGKVHNNANNVAPVGGAPAPAPAPVAVAAPAPQAAPAPASSPAGDKRQNSIVMQSSYKTGADVLSTALQSGALTLKGAKAAQYAQVLTYLDEITIHIFKNCTNPEEFLATQGEEDASDDPDSEYNPLTS